MPEDDVDDDDASIDVDVVTSDVDEATVSVVVAVVAPAEAYVVEMGELVVIDDDVEALLLLVDGYPYSTGSPEAAHEHEATIKKSPHSRMISNVSTNVRARHRVARIGGS